MPSNGNPTALLALEEKPNSFIPIDIHMLGFGFSCAILTLKDIDHFTMSYDENEIKRLIRNVNIVPLEALEGNLVILYEDNENKRKAPLLTKDIINEYGIIEILIRNINNKNFINQIVTKIKAMKLEESFVLNLIANLKNGNVSNFMNLYGMMNYLEQRKLYLYMIKVLKKKTETVLTLEKTKAEVE